MKKSSATELANLRHSLAHLLAAAVLEKFPKAKLGIGPVIENGFYYDILFREPIGEKNLQEFEKTMRKRIADRLVFRRERVTPRTARSLFREQRFKLDLIREFIKQRKPLTVYHTGDFVDLCRGGHVKNTSQINPDAFKLTTIAAAYWRGDEKNPQLTRIYGVAFGTKKELDDYLNLEAEIEKRDHRVLGERLGLYMFSEYAPGAPIWLPHGMTVFRELEKLWRRMHDGAGYQEISTPSMVKVKLFKRSGHWDYFRESMFYFDLEKETYALKPMNCPESTLVYSSTLRSYRDLPLRLSEIGRLHRNELSGALGGMFRVRQLTMDDAHIYCRPDQMQSEITGVLRLVRDFYGRFSFPAKFRLATKPPKALGSPKLWRIAEEALAKAMRANGIPFEILKGEGAFYGPKIHYDVRDVLGREWTLATVQVDFQMPERFDLTYTDAQGKKERPVMIHRAIFGSFERFIGILIEQYAGALPFWLAPVQIAILCLNDTVSHYAMELEHELKKLDYRVFVDGRNETIGKKIREAELAKIPYLLVIGPREMRAMTVAVRERGKGDRGSMTKQEFFDVLAAQLPRL